MSKLNVDKVDPSTGTALEIGSSGDTITVPSGATFAVSGTMNASSITAGTVATARLGSGTASSSTVLYGDQTYKTEPGLTGWTTGGTSNSLIPSATDQGIYLGVSSATATNLLDDYETSQTWTATLTDNSAATMAATIGKSYTLIGNICTITAYIHSWTDEGDGYLKSMALPFASAAAPRAAGALSVYNVPINYKGVVAEISGGSALLNFWELKDDAAANQYMEITGGEVMVSITYTIA